jgi:hypothetical protein
MANRQHTHIHIECDVVLRGSGAALQVVGLERSGMVVGNGLVP